MTYRKNGNRYGGTKGRAVVDAARDFQAPDKGKGHRDPNRSAPHSDQSQTKPSQNRRTFAQTKAAAAGRESVFLADEFPGFKLPDRGDRKAACVDPTCQGTFGWFQHKTDLVLLWRCSGCTDNRWKDIFNLIVTFGGADTALAAKDAVDQWLDRDSGGDL